MGLNKESKEIYLNNKDKGFWEDRENIPEIMKNSGLFTEQQINAVIKAFKCQLMMLIVSEISEAMEADRKDLNDDKITNRLGEEVEMADALIRIKDYAGGYNLDLEGAEKDKLEYNKSRPYKHGKNY